MPPTERDRAARNPTRRAHAGLFEKIACCAVFRGFAALTTAVVHASAPAFPLAGALTAAAILYGLSRKAFRNFAAEPGA